MSAIPEKQFNPNGLYKRYEVTKKDGEPTDPMATYFVLRLDGFGRDGQHIEACRHAALAYADYVQSGSAQHLSRVGQELRNLVENMRSCDSNETATNAAQPDPVATDPPAGPSEHRRG